MTVTFLRMHLLLLAGFVVPLGLDTFAVAAALGAGGLPPQRRLRVALTATAFEAGMPLVGLAAGRGVGAAVGGAAGWLAAAALAALGVWMLVADEGARDVGGLGLLAFGLSVSLDELAIGFTIGLLRLPVAAAVVVIAVQAFVAAQLGLRLGARMREAARERAERLAGVALLTLAALTLVDSL